MIVHAEISAKTDVIITTQCNEYFFRITMMIKSMVKTLVKIKWPFGLWLFTRRSNFY